MTAADLIWRVSATTIVGILFIFVMIGIAQEGRTNNFEKCVEKQGLETCKVIYSSLSVTEGKNIHTPAGYIDFCKRNPTDCTPGREEIAPIELTKELLTQLHKVNREVNNRIEWTSDDEVYGVSEYWNYPVEDQGDCEDHVLLKQRLLKELGWDQENLLITGVMMHDDREDTGHAVLTIRTTEGDYVLDNNTNSILLWSETEYDFLEIQSQSDPMKWLLIKESYSNEYFASTNRSEWNKTELTTAN